MDILQLSRETEISSTVTSAIDDISVSTHTITSALGTQPPGHLVRVHLEIINQNMKDVCQGMDRLSGRMANMRKRLQSTRMSS